MGSAVLTGAPTLAAWVRALKHDNEERQAAIVDAWMLPGNPLNERRYQKAMLIWRFTVEGVPASELAQIYWITTKKVFSVLEKAGLHAADCGCYADRAGRVAS